MSVSPGSRPPRRGRTVGKLNVIMLPPENVTAFVKFIVERHNIYLKRQANKPKPWTDDPILQRYRFCNVYRELDTVTQWISKNWREHEDQHPDVWFAMSVARWVNWPDSLAEIGIENVLPKFKPNAVVKALNARRDRQEKVWTGAYMIGTQGNAMDKVDFIVDKVLLPLWDNRAALRPKRGDTLQSFATRVIAVKNQGSFMVGQMVADTKYTDGYLSIDNATDWADWAVSGPGSRRGMNRVLNRELTKPWKEPDFLQYIKVLRVAVNLRIPPWMDQIHAQDLQNCLCEFDKYERVRLGQGRPRSTYPGTA